MGITGLLPFVEKASKKGNISEFTGCTVAIDSYCWLHKGAFACADKLVRGEDTDIHIRYCLKYVNMLLSKNIKPILVFDGRHLPAKALTESKRRESRDVAKKRAAELLRLGQIDEARSYMRRSVDITHRMALDLIQECRKRNVDCIVAPYEADAQLAYLNVKNYAQVVITEDSDLILFGCTKVFFKMDLDGNGTLVDTCKLPLVMKCSIERYTFDKFRQMCIMSGCDYLASLPGIGLAKARQFVTTTQDSDFSNALKKLPMFFNRSLIVTDEYRENFLKAEATFKHQFVYDPIDREMIQLTDPETEGTDLELCCNAGTELEPDVAFQLALGNLDPFSLKKMDNWDPDKARENEYIKTDSWNQQTTAPHPSIWNKDFANYLNEPNPWLKKSKKVESAIVAPNLRPVQKKVVNLVNKFVPETQDESLSIESLTHMYCVEPSRKRVKIEENINEKSSTNLRNSLPIPMNGLPTNGEKDTQPQPKRFSPILENKERSFRKVTSYSVLKRLSKFQRTVVDNDNVVESKFFNTNLDDDRDIAAGSQSSQKENDFNARLSNISDGTNSNNICGMDDGPSFKEKPILTNKDSELISPNKTSRNPFKVDLNNIKAVSEDSEQFIDNTYPLEELITPLASQVSFGESQNNLAPKLRGDEWKSKAAEKVLSHSQPLNSITKKSTCKAPGLQKRKASSSTNLPANQPTLLDKFGFKKKPLLKR